MLLLLAFTMYVFFFLSKIQCLEHPTCTSTAVFRIQCKGLPKQCCCVTYCIYMIYDSHILL